MLKQRYQITLERHELLQKDFDKLKIVFSSKSPKEAIRNVERIKKSDVNLSYFAKQFLEAVAISAEADLYVD